LDGRSGWGGAEANGIASAFNASPGAKDQLTCCRKAESGRLDHHPGGNGIKKGGTSEKFTPHLNSGRPVTFSRLNLTPKRIFRNRTEKPTITTNKRNDLKIRFQRETYGAEGRGWGRKRKLFSRGTEKPTTTHTPRFGGIHERYPRGSGGKKRRDRTRLTRSGIKKKS